MSLRVLDSTSQDWYQFIETMSHSPPSSMCDYDKSTLVLQLMNYNGMPDYIIISLMKPRRPWTFETDSKLRSDRK